MVASILANAVTITGFVLVMMLLVEYLNVATRGALRRRLQRRGGRLPAVLIGVVPGCFGAFTNVTLYVHGAVSLGALAGSMIAASGDEAFVMLALFPDRALALFALLFAWGLVVATIVDRLFGTRYCRQPGCTSGLAIHADDGLELRPFRLPQEGIRWSRDRSLLDGSLVVFSLAVGSGAVASDLAPWLRAIIVSIVLLLAAFVLVAPEHFVREHLVRHVVREHAPRIFLWTLGALLVTEWAMRSGLELEAFIRNHTTLALLVAAAVGVIPESGPHLIFATQSGVRAGTIDEAPRFSSRRLWPRLLQDEEAGVEPVGVGPDHGDLALVSGQFPGCDAIDACFTKKADASFQRGVVVGPPAALRQPQLAGDTEAEGRDLVPDSRKPGDRFMHDQESFGLQETMAHRQAPRRIEQVQHALLPEDIEAFACQAGVKERRVDWLDAMTEASPFNAPPQLGQRGVIRVDADNLAAAQTGKLDRHRPGAATDVQDAWTVQPGEQSVGLARVLEEPGS